MSTAVADTTHVVLLKSLLICMETSRHGCNPTIQLGNAVVMSLFIWFGLSCLYRVLAVLIAPSIQFKHCVSMIGYSFFAWNLAILGSFLLENYHDLLKLPAAVPLVLFGVPSSLAQVGELHRSRISVALSCLC